MDYFLIHFLQGLHREFPTTNENKHSITLDDEGETLSINIWYSGVWKQVRLQQNEMQLKGMKILTELKQVLG